MTKKVEKKKNTYFLFFLRNRRTQRLKIKEIWKIRKLHIYQTFYFLFLSQIRSGIAPKKEKEKRNHSTIYSRSSNYYQY